jgi:hypothetical protein
MAVIKNKKKKPKNHHHREPEIVWGDEGPIPSKTHHHPKKIQPTTKVWIGLDFVRRLFKKWS